MVGEDVGLGLDVEQVFEVCEGDEERGDAEGDEECFGDWGVAEAGLEHFLGLGCVVGGWVDGWMGGLSGWVLHVKERVEEVEGWVGWWEMGRWEGKVWDGLSTHCFLGSA